jgi:hypothetical protein
MMNTNEVSEVPTVPGRRKPFQRPTQYELNQIRSTVATLSAKLYKERFGQEMEPWDGADTAELNKFLLVSSFPTLEEVEQLIRNYFASDGITDARPWLFLKDISKYGGGPLNASGESKTWIANTRREMAAAADAASAEANRRKQSIEAEDRDLRLRRATSMVVCDLERRGYSAFKPVFAATCHLLAISTTASASSVPAIRIIVTTDRDGISKNVDVIQAHVELGHGQAARVTYVPDLGRG